MLTYEVIEIYRKIIAVKLTIIHRNIIFIIL